jgi:hypothetical protein
VGYIVGLVQKRNPTTGAVEKDSEGRIILEQRPIGTAFAAMYEQSGSAAMLFLATAKHVVFDDRGVQRRPLWVQFMGKENERPELFPLSSGWLTHEDKGVDLAIQPGLPANAHARRVQSSIWLTDDDVKTNGIAVGDEVFYTGLLPQHPGEKRLMPITRFGKLALVTEERSYLKLTDTESSGLLLHFIDASNAMGHSGSPVFLWAIATRSGRQMVLGDRIFRLYGVVSNVLEYSDQLKGVPTRSMIPLDYRSSGVTGVVPVRYLREIMEYPKTKAAFAVGASRPASP